MQFKGTNILIIGASSGIGEALAKKLAKTACNITLLARRTDKLEQIALSLQDAPAKISIAHCDVADSQQVSDAVNAFCASNGRIDLAVINAGVSQRNPFTSFSLEDARNTININVMGVINCLHALTPIFMRQKSGYIAGVASMADTRGFARSGVYSASKAAVTLLLESAAVELAQYNVKVTTIRPGFVKTAMTDKNEFKMLFLMPVEKAADIICKGLEKEKRYIAFPLRMKLLVDLVGVLPNRLFEYLSKLQYEKLQNDEED